MRITLLLILIVFCRVTCLGQHADPLTKTAAQEVTIKRQILIDDLENQLKDVPLAAVRVFVRARMAAWFWKAGKDETGNAERLSVKAIDELYEKRSEIPSLYFNVLRTDLFALLELIEKRTAAQLKAKYDSGSEDDLESAFSNLDKKDGERRAADNVLNSFTNQSDFSPNATLLIDQLQSGQSSELTRILSAIIYLEETNRNDFSPEALFLIVDNFRSSAVTNDLRRRFFRVILNKAGSVGRSPESVFNLLSSVMPDITVNAPNLLPEANALQAALTSRISNATREARERNQRIAESTDKLGALISEAEKANDKVVKYRLQVDAAQVALRDGRFRLAVELANKTIDSEPFVGIPDDFRKSWHDQFLGDVLQSALKKSDLDSATYATKKVIDKLSMAELLRKTAVYYSEKRDIVSATDALDEAINLTTKAEVSTMRIYGLIRLVSTAQKIDKSRLSEVVAQAARSFEKIPSLNPEDKPGTEKYEKYVTSIMVTNWNLLPVIGELARNNRNEAIDFGDRINKKEIKIIVNYALAVESLNAEKRAPGLR